MNHAYELVHNALPHRERVKLVQYWRDVVPPTRAGKQACCIVLFHLSSPDFLRRGDTLALFRVEGTLPDVKDWFIMAVIVGSTALRTSGCSRIVVRSESSEQVLVVHLSIMRLTSS